MNRFKNAVLLWGLSLVALGPLGAQEADEDLFSGLDLVSEDPGTQDSGAGDLLESKGVTLGGSFSLESLVKTDPSSWADTPPAETLLPALDLKTTLLLDARPEEDYRVFLKANLASPFSGPQDVTLREIFADFNLSRTLFVRAGKQTVNWGVGYFFSPANLISLQAKDPEDPTKELLGPLAVKANLPLGPNNYYLYTVLEDLTTRKTAGLAPRGEWVLGDSEVTLSGYYRPSEPWGAAGTWSGRWGDVNLFGEGVLRGQVEKVFVVTDPQSPLGLSTETRKDSLFFQGTLGFTWSWTEEAGVWGLNAAGQYYFNGLGYADPRDIFDRTQGLMALLGSGKVPQGDLAERSQHYGAFSLGISNIFDADLGLSLFWMGNLADQSGKTSATLSWKGFDHLTLSTGYTLGYGTEGGEFNPQGLSHSLSLRIILGAGTF